MIEFLEGRKEETLSELPNRPGVSYGKFMFSRLEKGQGLTLANTLRRILLYEFSSVGITSVAVCSYDTGFNNSLVSQPFSETKGAISQLNTKLNVFPQDISTLGLGSTGSSFFHEFSTLPDIKESISEILLNLQSLVFKNTFPYTEPQKAFLFLDVNSSPSTGGFAGELGSSKNYAVSFSAADIVLPAPTSDGAGLLLIFPSQHIGTRATAGQRLNLGDEKKKQSLLLEMTIEPIKHTDIQNHSANSPHGRRKQDRLVLPIDGSVFPIKKVNYTIERDANSLGGVGEIVFFEIWTNGSIEPKEAMNQAIKKSVSLFNRFL